MTAIVLLTHNRTELLKRVVEESLPLAGVPNQLFIVDNGSTDPHAKEYISTIPDAVKILLPNNSGTANGLNVGIKMAYDLGYTHFQLCSNDIFEAPNWVAERVKYIDSYPRSGMVSVRHGDVSKSVLSQEVLPIVSETPIGQFMISRDVIDKVGFLSTRYSRLYAPIDCDYAARCKGAGFINYYIPNIYFSHVGSHGGENTSPEYGYIKDDHLRITWPEYTQRLPSFNNPENCYIPYEPKI